MKETPQWQQPDHAEDQIDDHLKDRRPAFHQRWNEGHHQNPVNGEADQKPENAERDAQGRFLAHQNGP